RALIFFFQAEDGIRDYKVTGVQTCALPICDAAAAALTAVVTCRPAIVGLSEDRQSRRYTENFLAIANLLYKNFCAARFGRRQERSEERRVGKGWRGRGGWEDRRGETMRMQW